MDYVVLDGQWNQQNKTIELPNSYKHHCINVYIYIYINTYVYTLYIICCTIIIFVTVHQLLSCSEVKPTASAKPLEWNRTDWVVKQLDLGACSNS